MASGLPKGVFNLVTGYRPGGGRGARRSSRGRHGLVHRFDARREAHLRARRGPSSSASRWSWAASAPSIILDDADLAAAVKGTVDSLLPELRADLRAHTRMLVPEIEVRRGGEARVAEAAKYTVGDPFAETSTLGPLVSAAQRERVRGYIRKGIEEGAELLSGGPDAPPALPWAATCSRPCSDASIRSRRSRRRRSSARCCRSSPTTTRTRRWRSPTALDVRAGRRGVVEDESRAVRVARRMRTGQVDINGGPFNLLAPFGGFKQSGHGREYEPRRAGGGVPKYKSLQFKPERKT